MDAWECASAAEDLGVLPAAADRVHDSIGRLNSAHDRFHEAGASRDVARVRGRYPAGRPASGVRSLTETERNIAALASQGFTNRQIAKQTFTSSNTVAFHLRNVYRKLGIKSRTQLARALPGHG